MSQSIQEWTKQNLWKTAIKKFEGACMVCLKQNTLSPECFVPYIVLFRVAFRALPDIYDGDFWQGLKCLKYTFAHTFMTTWACFNSLQLSVAFHVETSHLICCVNQMTGFNMQLTMGWDGLMSSQGEAWFYIVDSLTKWFWLKVCDNNFHEPPCFSWLN